MSSEEPTEEEKVIFHDKLMKGLKEICLICKEGAPDDHWRLKGCPLCNPDYPEDKKG